MTKYIRLLKILDLTPEKRFVRDYYGFSTDEIYEMGWHDMRS